MAIQRLGIATPPPNTPILIATVSGNGLADLVATNIDDLFVYVDAWVKPSDSITSSDNYTILYNIIVPAFESLNSHKFTVNENDEIYVKSSGNTSFIINAIQEGVVVR
jgi:hypothetical protein